MINIHPMSDLRNRTETILEIAHAGDQPVFITRKGKGDSVIMSLAHYERLRERLELYEKLSVAEVAADAGEVGITHDEIMAELRLQLNV